METPSSTRRVTRSQALAAQSSSTKNIPLSRKSEDSEKAQSKSRPRNGKQALIDITNDSPIVGLAMGSLETPSSAIAKQRSCRAKSTPGSGEALLRGQVKTLLQQVEEEAELSKITLETRPLHLIQGLSGNFPMGLLAPTPTNTPQVSDLSVDASGSNSVGVSLEKPSPLVQEHLISQVVCDIFEGKNQEGLESQKSNLSRSLLLDFSEKSEISDISSECSSVIAESKERSATDDDSASIWSMQVNDSTHDEDEEEVAEGEEDYYLDEDDEIEEEEEEKDGGYDLDELCDGINKIFVDEKKMFPKSEGKHKRFVYDSEDEEIVEEEDCSSAKSPDSPDVVSPSALRLKGLPTPKGQHLRFS